MMYTYGFYPFHMFGFAWMVICWAFVIWLIVHFVRKFTHHDCRHEQHTENALDVVKKRYAKGEITKEQFESIKKDIA